MMKTKPQISFLVFLSVMSVWLITGMAFAGPPAMEEVKSQYMQATGKDWEGASADEKKEFLDILETRRKANSAYHEKGGRLQELKDMSTQKERTPFHIRHAFEKETGIYWEDASQEEQEDFEREYGVLIKKIKREQKSRDREITLEKKEIRLEKNAEKREMMLRDKKKNREKNLELAEERRKRAEEKRKLRNAKKERNALLKELNKKMEREE